MHMDAAFPYVSLLNIGHSVCEVANTSSDTHTGGEDFDQRESTHRGRCKGGKTASASRFSLGSKIRARLDGVRWIRVADAGTLPILRTSRRRASRAGSFSLKVLRWRIITAAGTGGRRRFQMCSSTTCSWDDCRPQRHGGQLNGNSIALC